MHLYKLAGRAKSHAGLFTFAGDIGDGRHADPLELRLADDVALHQNTMILQRLGIEPSSEITEIRKAVVPKPKLHSFGRFDFLAYCNVPHRGSDRARCVPEHP